MMPKQKPTDPSFDELPDEAKELVLYGLEARETSPYLFEEIIAKSDEIARDENMDFESRNMLAIVTAILGVRKILEKKHAFADEYHAYLRTNKWKMKADAARERAGHRCQVCNRPSGKVQLDVHHRTYERIFNEAPEDLTVLCHDCHIIFEKHKRKSR
jgi:hypothetical protein